MQLFTQNLRLSRYASPSVSAHAPSNSQNFLSPHLPAIEFSNTWSTPGCGPPRTIIAFRMLFLFLKQELMKINLRNEYLMSISSSFPRLLLSNLMRLLASFISSSILNNSRTPSFLIYKCPGSSTQSSPILHDAGTRGRVSPAWPAAFLALGLRSVAGTDQADREILKDYLEIQRQSKTI